MSSVGFIVFISTLCSLIWGWVSRMCGGAPIHLPFGLDSWVYGIPYAVVGFLFGPLWGLLSYGTAFLGKRLGHGQYMDLGTWTKIIEPEKIDFIVRLFFGEDPNETVIGVGNFWRDFTGLSIGGLLVALGCGLTLIVNGYPLLGCAILLGGALKGISYAVGWKLQGAAFGSSLNEPTEWGELLTGIVGTLPVFLAIFWILLK